MSLTDTIKALFNNRNEVKFDPERRRFLGNRSYNSLALTVLVSALGLTGCTGKTNPPNPPLSIAPDTPPAVSGIQNKVAEGLDNFEQFNDEAYHLHDALIIRYTNFWNEYFQKKFTSSTFDGINLGYKFEALDPMRVKAMIMLESGSPKHRTTAYRYDPMQIANQGDYALAMLRDGQVEGKPEWLIDRLREDASLSVAQELADIRNTPRDGDVWNYDAVPEQNRINAELSIKYGILWLWTRQIIIGEVKEGDTIAGYAIKNTRGWDSATERYNGREIYRKNVWRLMNGIKPK